MATMSVSHRSLMISTLYVGVYVRGNNAL